MPLFPLLDWSGNPKRKDALRLMETWRIDVTITSPTGAQISNAVELRRPSSVPDEQFIAALYKSVSLWFSGLQTAIDNALTGTSQTGENHLGTE